MVDERSAVLETEALTRDFGDFRAVDAVTFSVLRGEIFGLIGPNGASKSTLVKMLTTLLPPTSGRPLAELGSPASTSSPRRRRCVPTSATCRNCSRPTAISRWRRTS